MENCVLYDAFSLTSRIDSPQTIIQMLGLESAAWECVKGAHGYQDRFYWNCISVHYNGRDDMGVWLELTGQGCRAFETYGNGNYERLFDYAIFNRGEVSITRLDVAFDDHVGILDIDTLCQDTVKHEFVSRFSEWQVIQGSKGSAVNHGSMKSDVFIRIYDKAAERGFDDGRHWIRVELQLRRDRAYSFVSLPGALGDNFSGVLLNYLKYVVPDPTDSNMRRWPMKDYWQQLIGAAGKLQIYEKPGTDYNIFNLDNFVFKQAGNATAAMIEISGVDAFLDKLRRRGTQQNPKYDRLVNLYGRKENEKNA